MMGLVKSHPITFAWLTSLLAVGGYIQWIGV